MSIIKTPIPTTNPSGALIGYNNLIVTATGAQVQKSVTPNTYERWEDASGTMTGVFQLATNSSLTFVGIAGHNLFSSGSTKFEIRVASTIGGGTTTIATIPILSDSAIMVEIDEPDVAEITIFMPDGTDREIAVVYAGISLQMPTDIYGGHSPITLSAKTKFRAIKSESGQILGKDIIRQGLESNFSWQFLDPDFYRSEFKPFVKSARTLPFFIKWRVDLYPDEVAYGEVNQDITPVNMGGHNKMSVSFKMTAHSDIDL